jgi:RNA polymerase sigma-70 factor (ECF subfamily)
VSTPPIAEDELVERLRAGDEAAFSHLVDTYYRSMLHVARGYVASTQAAEDVVQETLLGVIRGLATFEGRSSLKTWMFRILVNRATTRGEREGRVRPFSSLGGDGPTVDPDRFESSGRWKGFWSEPPTHREIPEANVLATEIGARLMAAIVELAPTQRAVIELRDVQGLTSAEVCELLDITEANQRVLLHRARARVRQLLEDYLR